MFIQRICVAFVLDLDRKGKKKTEHTRKAHFANNILSGKETNFNSIN